MINKAFVKAGIYFSHYECFGHTSRVLAISQVFKKKFPSGNFFFIQAGVQQPMAKLDQGGQVYTVPSPFLSRNNFRVPVREAGIHAQERAQACLDIIARENPALFLTEFFPLGREESRHELIPALVKAAAQGAELWAVAGYPLLIGTGEGWREKILELYQKVIIFAPAQEKEMIEASFTNEQERQRYHAFFERHKSKIVFAGYLLPHGGVITYKEDENIPKPPMSKGACRVAVVRGGGAYYPKVIAEAIQASDSLGDQYYLDMVAGPSTTTEEWYFFSTLMAKKKIKNAVLHKSVVDYEGLIRESDVCVTTASYHTAVMLLKYQKKAVIIPFEGYDQGMPFQEQPARARMLNEAMGASILPIGKLTAKSLASFITEAGQRKLTAANIPPDWFLGAEYLERGLAEFFSLTEPKGYVK